MTYDAFNKCCCSLTATSHVMQWGGAHVWKVGGKVFAIGGWQKSDQAAFTFKVSDIHFEMLHDAIGFRPAPYLASRGMQWIQQHQTMQKTDKKLKYYIAESHRIVSLGLTKKMQRELGLNQGKP